ncbi:hypothetical protein [Methanosphaera sp. BMS]|uniref:hypothetical protein n=1 Tax=Methanosphaera sp. BMS TaxID=1789762 RepID=UPI000DC1D25C|nr:hypothetical protein [Methanosphaera sp. BMS]AWX31783.1 hypothetical protein AW729_01175 [Methanosphaera sp. BMS]
MTEYIERENQKFKSFMKDEIDGGLMEFLEKEYGYIYESIVDEEYIIEYPDFSTFFELTYDNKVVGFYTTDTIFDNKVLVCINEFYVLPEFRSNKIFLYQIINLLQTPNITVVLRKPTRIVVDILISNGLAFEFADNLIFTYIKFINNYGSVFVNNKIKKAYHTIDSKYLGLNVMGNVYDYKHCMTIFDDVNEIFVKKPSTICFSMPRRYDVKQYNLVPKLKKIDKNYLRQIRRNINKNRDRVYEISTIIYNNIYSGLNVDNLIGTEDMLHEYTIELLEEHGLTEDDGQKIRSKIQQALDEEEILPNTIRRRFEYLLLNPDADALAGEDDTEGVCPYCEGEVAYSLETCEICGYNFYKDADEQTTDDDIQEREIDEKTQLEVGFLESIDTDVYDVGEVFDAQFEVAANEALGLIDMYQNEPLRINIEEVHHIKDGLVLDYLLENDYIEQKQNDNYDEYVYKITKKGRRHYKQNPITNLYSSNLQGFDYYKFKKYYNDNIADTKKEEIVENYIQNIEATAISQNDYATYNQILLNNLLTSRNIQGDKEFLIQMLKAMICQLNEYKLAEDKKNLLPIKFEMDNYMQLFDVINEDYDLIELYVKAYNDIELEDLKINKEDNLEALQKLAETKDLLRFNLAIMESSDDE